MTVAVANRSLILADTRTENGNVHIDCPKIAQILFKKQPYAVCGAGEARDCELFIQHFKKHGFQPPEHPWTEGFEALILAPDGLYHVDAGGAAGLVRTGWAAIGSGGDVAIGALEAMLDGSKRQPTREELYRAMQIAFRRCGGCGGEIDEVKRG